MEKRDAWRFWEGGGVGGGRVYMFWGTHRKVENNFWFRDLLCVRYEGNQL